MTTNPMRTIALVVTLAAVALSAALLYQLDGDAIGLMRRLRFQGETPDALGIGWIVVAPLLFVLASSYVQVATGPWMLLAVVQIGVVAVVTVQLRDMMSTAYFLTAAWCAAAAFVSVIVATAGRSPRPGEF